MLDTDMIEQLKGVFGRLENPITLRMATSNHEAQAELTAMLQGLASTSPLIRVEESGTASTAPSFEILHESKATGIRFRGVPGGHEFTSLILSILYADGKGKLPDEGIIARIRQRGDFDADTAASFALGLKLFGQVMLTHRDHPLFEEMGPQFGAFMKKLKSRPAD